MNLCNVNNHARGGIFDPRNADWPHQEVAAPQIDHSAQYVSGIPQERVSLSDNVAVSQCPLPHLGSKEEFPPQSHFAQLVSSDVGVAIHPDLIPDLRKEVPADSRGEVVLFKVGQAPQQSDGTTASGEAGAQLERGKAGGAHPGTGTPFIEPVNPDSFITRSVAQAFVTAETTVDMFENYLQKDLSFNPDAKGRIPIIIGHPDAQQYGPHFSRSTLGAVLLDGPQSAANPDIVAHEVGHAILENSFQHAIGHPLTNSAHEAFADVTAFLSALQSPAVRHDFQIKHAADGQGSQPGKAWADNIGENCAHISDKQSDDNHGLRSLSQDSPHVPESKEEECHQASLRFSHACCSSLQDIHKNLQAKHPELSADASMEQAVHQLGRDFAGILNTLPPQKVITQGDLAQAMLASCLKNRQLDNFSIYSRAFTQAGLLETATNVPTPVAISLT